MSDDDQVEGAEGEGEMDDVWAQAMQEQEDSEDEGSAYPAELEELADTSGGADDDGEDVNLNVILDVPVELSMEIGRTHISIRNLLHLNQGSVVELDRLAGDPLDVMVNGTLIAHGEVVVVNDRFGIRLTDVVSPQERVKKLR